MRPDTRPAAEPASSRCRRCRRPVRWVRTEAGKAMPLDSFPNSEGNVTLGAGGRARVLGPEAAAAAKADSEVLWMPHFATCSTRRPGPRA